MSKSYFSNVNQCTCAKIISKRNVFFNIQLGNASNGPTVKRVSLPARSQRVTFEDKMIENFSEGYLKYPSADLVALLTALEKGILQTVGQCELEFYTFQHILVNVLAETL